MTERSDGLISGVPAEGFDFEGAVDYLDLDRDDLLRDLRAGAIEGLSSDLNLATHRFCEADIDRIANFYDPVVSANLGPWAHMFDKLSEEDRQLVYQTVLSASEPCRADD